MNEFFPLTETLRDSFARTAMASLLLNNEYLHGLDELSQKPTRLVIAEYAYALADAMLAERSK